MERMKTTTSAHDVNDQLSRVLSALAQLARDEHEAFEDLDAFGDSDCGGIVARGYDRRRAATFAAFGFSEDTLTTEVVARCGARAARRVLDFTL